MSEEMAVTDNIKSEESKLNSAEDTDPTIEESSKVLEKENIESEEVPGVLEAKTEEGQENEETKADEVDKPVEAEEMGHEEKETFEMTQEEMKENIDSGERRMNVEIEIDKVKSEKEENLENIMEEVNKGIKRRLSDAFSDLGDDDFKGFDFLEKDLITAGYSRVVERLEAEVSAAVKDFTPLKQVMATPPALVRASKRARTDTDGSRPSSALSSRSDDNTDISTPGVRGRRATTEMSSPILRVPLEKGWKRELVYRAALDAHSRRNADIYYYTPYGKKLRSTREVSEHLSGTGLTLENFSFFKEPLGVDDPEKEIIRDAKMQRRIDSPAVSTPPAAVGNADGRRVSKPRVQDIEKITSPPAKIKVKSLGSRISNAAPAPAAPATPTPVPATTPTPEPKKQAKKPAPPPTTTTDNNNSAAWKKPSDEKKKVGRIANGASPPPLASPRRRGRPKADAVVDDKDYFTPFYTTAQERNYNVVVQIFQYLGMRDLSHCLRVCRLWRSLAAAPALWRHVRMKNSHVSDWAGLCSILKRHGTKRLDLRKMLLPQNDALFWEQFTEQIASVDTLERLELCRCPARAVEAVCRALPGLRALSAPAIRDARLDPEPLGALSNLHELRLKSMAGLSLERDLAHLARLSNLQHLSLTSIKELGWCACEVVGALPQLETLELGECTFKADFALALSRLTRLRRLRLERGTAHAAAPATLRALAALPLLTRLELVNVDVKVGFDDALAECKNIQRLLIIPTYVSQSATTNKQVLSGVLRLKESLTHLMWGVTIELLRVTELFIDQCSEGGGAARAAGECIPVLKPVPGCRPPAAPVPGPPQVEILPLPTLTRLLHAQLPHTRLKLLRIPFHATWRQSLADFH